MRTTIGLLGDVDLGKPTHRELDAAVARLPVDIEARRIASDHPEARELDGLDGLWVIPGSPYRDDDAADGRPYASLVNGCTAEECDSRLGQGIGGHLVSRPPLVGTAGSRDRASRCRGAPRGAGANRAAAATAWSAGQRPDVRQRPEGAYGARARAARADPARPPCAPPGPGHDRRPDEPRADGGAHAPLPDVRALSTERWALSQAAPLSRLRGQMRRKEQS